MDKLTNEMIEVLDEEMTKLKGIGLSDIDIHIIKLALMLTK